MHWLEFLHYLWECVNSILNEWSLFCLGVFQKKVVSLSWSLMLSSLFVSDSLSQILPLGRRLLSASWRRFQDLADHSGSTGQGAFHVCLPGCEILNPDLFLNILKLSTLSRITTDPIYVWSLKVDSDICPIMDRYS